RDWSSDVCSSDLEGTDAFGVQAMVGLVANDHVTLKVAVGHRTPLKRIEPPTSTLSVTWSWQVDVQRRQSVDVSAGVRRTGQHSELVFGVELGIHLDRKSTRLNSSHVKISYAV